VPFHLDKFLKPHYDQSFIWALIPLLNPFALLAGLISVAMLAMHGAVWLQMRTEDMLADRAKGAIRVTAPFVTVAFAGAGLWLYFGIDGYRIVSQPGHGALPNPLAKEVVRDAGAWFAIYGKQPLALIAPALGLAAPLLTVLLSQVGRPGLAFVTSSLAMAGVIATAGLSMFPFVMPSSSHPGSSLTLWDAASSHLTLKVMFWAVVIFLPIVLSYTAWCYSRMWGKVTIAEIEARSHSAY
jgi:cytochrome d ubiquinol oxidase subunit II